MFSKEKRIRHTRILSLRDKITKGWTMEQLFDYCKNNLSVTRKTALSYIDEAAEPFRKKFKEQTNESN